MDEDQYVEIVISLMDVIKGEAIVDWYKNVDVKRKIRNKLDDYLYDEVKGSKAVDLTNTDINKIIDKSMKLAENNFETLN